MKGQVWQTTIKNWPVFNSNVSDPLLKSGNNFQWLHRDFPPTDWPTPTSIQNPRMTRRLILQWWFFPIPWLPISLSGCESTDILFGTYPEETCLGKGLEKKDISPVIMTMIYGYSPVRAGNKPGMGSFELFSKNTVSFIGFPVMHDDNSQCIYIYIYWVGYPPTNHQSTEASNARTIGLASIVPLLWVNSNISLAWHSASWGWFPVTPSHSPSFQVSVAVRSLQSPLIEPSCDMTKKDSGTKSHTSTMVNQFWAS